MKKRITALVLAAVMIILIFPSTALAASIPIEPSIHDEYWFLSDYDSAIELEFSSNPYMALEVQYSKNRGSWRSTKGKIGYAQGSKYNYCIFDVDGSGSYRVRMRYVSGKSYSSWDYATIKIPKYSMRPITGLAVTEATLDSINYSWDKVTNADELYIWYNADYMSSAKAYKKSTTTTSATFSNLRMDTEYEVGVEAGKRYSNGYMYIQKRQKVMTDSLKPIITSGATFKKSYGTTHKITVEAKFDGDVTTRITNATGKTVKNIEYYQTYTAGSHDVYWDGTDSKGEPVPAGTYNIVAIERDQNNNIYYSKKKLEYIINETPTVGSNSRYTKTGANRQRIQYSVSEDCKVTVAIKDAKKRTIRNIEYKVDRTAGEYSVYWDGKDNKGNVVNPGVYFIYVIRYDEDGSYHYRRKKLSYTTFNYPTIYSNSYYTRSGTNRHLIKVDIATDTNVSTCVKDANFKTVLYLEYKVQHEDGRFYVYWDGKDKNGNDVPNGTYYIYAIKYNKDGTYKWRRKKLTLN